MVTHRALVIYNFGIALILFAIGLASVLAGDNAAQQSSRLTQLPTFDEGSRQALEQQADLEQLRARTLFYFDLAKELKRARNIDTTRYFYDARTAVWILATLFVLAGLMVLTLPREPKVPPAPQ
ncbi:MAG TPA: hypothetical protein VFB08_19835 [Burkholderiales bacterium]|nr:hypothetical protein [Burkholderiales bacterium]